MSATATRSVVHDTFVLERSYAASPEKVFAAFADPAKKRRWFVDAGGNHIDSYEQDFREGGFERVRLRFKEGMPVSGLACATDTLYQAIQPGRTIVFAATMAIAGRIISATQVTIELIPDGAGTNMILTHQAAFFEGSDGPERRRMGWTHLLGALAAELAS
ncbi:MAG: SRPBCC domain-containing protein [Acidobacteria bacterium]|nr:SRPBCC domain-containing protein [Acidobacteriota bacterium]